jgi:hypothetical protein
MRTHAIRAKPHEPIIDTSTADTSICEGERVGVGQRPGSGASPLVPAPGMGRGAAAGGAAAGGAAAGGAAAGVSATGSKLWDLALRVDTVGADTHPTCSRCAARVALRLFALSARGCGPDRPFSPPACIPSGWPALQALRELGIDYSDRHNVVNERNGEPGSACGCSEEASQRRGLS